MENETDNTIKTDKPWLWKKGFCPNPGGRPKGKSMKEYAREYLSKMTDEERDGWLDGLNKETIWKMSEGNPDNKTKIGGDGDGELQPILVKFINGNENNKYTSGVQKTV
jgi:hypothetical protein